MHPRHLITATVALVASLLVAGAAGAGASSASGPSARIIAGEVGDPAAWPFAAALYERDLGRDSLHCGATVIAPRFAVTAAHCVVGIRAPVGP